MNTIACLRWKDATPEDFSDAESYAKWECKPWNMLDKSLEGISLHAKESKAVINI